MVVIPRYQSSLGSAPIRSGRRITTGTGAASGLAELGKTISEGLNSYSEQKIALTAKLRDQEILNKSLLADAEAKTINSNFVNNYLDTIEDYREYNTEYDRYWKTREENIKKKFFTVGGELDQVAWERYQPNYWAEYVDGKTKVNAKVAEARNYETITTYRSWYEGVNTDIENSKTIAQLESKYKEANALWSSYEGNQTFSEEDIAQAKETQLRKFNDRYFILQATRLSENGKEPTYVNPDGVRVVDYGEIANLLSNQAIKYKDITGRTVDFDNEDLQALIREMQQQGTTQMGFDTNRRATLGKQQYAKYVENVLNNITPNGVSIDEYNTAMTVLFTDEYSQMNPEDKDQIINSLNSAVGRSDRKADAQAAERAAKNEAEADLNYTKFQILIGTGIFDSAEEINIIRQLGFEGHFGNNNVQLLVDQAIDLQDDRNSWKAESFKRGVQTLGTAIGVTYNFDEQNRYTDFTSGTSFLESKVDSGKKLKIDGLQAQMFTELSRLVLIGEQRGISHYDMLENVESPNYLITPIIQKYNKEISKAIAGEYDKMLNDTFDRGDAIIVLGNRFLMKESFFDDQRMTTKQGTTQMTPNLTDPANGVDLPLFKKDQETIDMYLSRLDQFLKTNPTTAGKDIPSILTTASDSFADGIIVDSE
jgi:hypothetical protein|tara:strand:- start:19051 stop:21006 length:1956 start_codon:yes stop_codon:yes gene_type:complete